MFIELKLLLILLNQPFEWQTRSISHENPLSELDFSRVAYRS